MIEPVLVLLQTDGVAQVLQELEHFLIDEALLELEVQLLALAAATTHFQIYYLNIIAFGH